MQIHCRKYAKNAQICRKICREYAKKQSMQFSVMAYLILLEALRVNFVLNYFQCLQNTLQFGYCDLNSAVGFE